MEIKHNEHEHESLSENIGEVLEDIEEVIEDAFTYDEERHGRETAFGKSLLLLRNIDAALAAVLFVAYMVFHIPLLSAVAYFFGAVAYLSEILIMTECFKRHASHDELFMAVVFGPLYLLMGVSHMLR